MDLPPSTIDPPKPSGPRVRRSDLARAMRAQVALVESALASLDSEPGDTSLIDGLLILIDRTADLAKSSGFPSVEQAVRDLAVAGQAAMQPGAGAVAKSRFEDAFAQVVSITDDLVSRYDDSLPRVLVVDSAAPSLAEESEWLRGMDFEVLTATNGAQGMHLAQSEHPDLIFLEANLADTDGFEVCYHLQHDPRTADVPVVFLTARNRPQDHARAFAVGASAYIEKPTSWSDLATQARQHLRQHREQRIDRPRKAAHAEVVKAAPVHGDLAGFHDFLMQRMDLRNDQLQTLREAGAEGLIRTAAALGLAEATLASWLAEYCHFPLLATLQPERAKLGVLPLTFSKAHLVVPMAGAEGDLVFALANPFDDELKASLALFLASGDATLAISPAGNVMALLDMVPAAETVVAPESTELDASDLAAEIAELGSSDLFRGDVDSLKPEQSAPLVRLVNKLIDKAVDLGASDIHIEPSPTKVTIRYRVDGRLLVGYELRPARLIFPMAARIKVMAGLSLGDRRLPQDGRIAYAEFSHGVVDVDLRVSLIPLMEGEKIVMRLLDRQRSVMPLDALGFAPHTLEAYRSKIEAPYGMILHVGPTGSGKSMTLYAALNEIKTPEVNVTTAEDPVEYRLDGINQLQVHPSIGLTFARCLRSFLRQDPDIILVGEIRDRETADVAVEAAMTGHLVLSTLHTNDAATTIQRFIEMGVEPFLVSSSIMMVCAQRLVRRLCTKCRKEDEPTPYERSLMGPLMDHDGHFYRAVGCQDCRGTGYRGRIGVHEVLILDDELRALVNQPGLTAERLKQAAVGKGMTTLYWDAIEKVRNGTCSLDDVLLQVMPDGFDSVPQRLRPAGSAPAKSHRHGH